MFSGVSGLYLLSCIIQSLVVGGCPILSLGQMSTVKTFLCVIGIKWCQTVDVD